jgi:hypothetical protein
MGQFAFYLHHFFYVAVSGLSTAQTPVRAVRGQAGSWNLESGVQGYAERTAIRTPKGSAPATGFSSGAVG